MALNDIKGVRENAGATYDEIVINPVFKKHHGIELCGVPTFDNTEHILTVPLSAGHVIYWINGVQKDLTVAPTCDLDDFVTLTANTLYFFYFDEAVEGTLKASTDFPSLRLNAIIATVYWNGSVGAINYEAHNHTRDIDWHLLQHQTEGAKYLSGLDITAPTTANDGALDLSTGSLADEDIRFTTGQCTTSRIWYKVSPTKYTFVNSALPYAGTTGQPQYLDTDTDTLTNVAAADFVCMWVYGTTDTLRPIQIVPTHAANDHGIIANARAEVQPSLSGLGLNPEWKLLYRWIFKGNGDFEESVDYRGTDSTPSGGSAGTTAGAVSFTPTGNIAATNVQAMGVELDTEKVPYTGANANVNLGTYTLTTPSIIGGSAGDSKITHKSTTGTGNTNGIAHQWTGGTDGATVIATMLNNGNVGMGTIAPGMKLDLGAGYNTEISTLRTGTFELQPYALNNAFVAENAYYNLGWNRRNAGFAEAFHFYNGQTQFMNTASGSAGAFTATYPLKTDSSDSGTVALGGNINLNAGTYTGASMVVLGTGNVGIGDTNPAEKLTVAGKTKATEFISTVATGTAPLTVASTTMVGNLNADLLDGQEGSYYAATSAIPVKATGAELNTATNDDKFATAKALKDGEFVAIHVGTTGPADTTKLWLDTN